jgi:hypothetical protein
MSDDLLVGDDDLARKIRDALPNRRANVTPISPTVAAADIAAQLYDLAASLVADPLLADVVLVVLSSPRQAQPGVRALGRRVSQAEVDGLLLQAAVAAHRP